MFARRGGKPAKGSADPLPDGSQPSDDGRTIYFKSDDEAGRASIWAVPVTAGRPRQVVRFDASRPSIRPDFAVGAGRIFFFIEGRRADIVVGEIVRPRRNTLVTVNGDNVPATITHDDVGITIRGGSFVINADGNCVSRMVILAPNGHEVAREVAGAYTRDGEKLTIQWQGAGVTEGAADGKTFTMDNGGMVLCYRK